MADEAAKNLKFDGTERLGFHRYKRQLLAIGGIKGGFDEALIQTLPIPSVISSGHDDVIRKRKLAWSYLYLTLDGAPLAMVERQTSQDPTVAWKALCD